jgi:hypothetical protein
VSERLLTAREFAGQLAVSPETVLRWTRDGLLDDVALKLPRGGWRYRPDRIDAWLDDHAAPGRGERQLTPSGAARGAYPEVSFLSPANPATNGRDEEDN